MHVTVNTLLWTRKLDDFIAIENTLVKV